MTATAPTSAVLDVDVPADLSARQPAEATPGSTRLDVRMMVSDGRAAPTHHAVADLPTVLRPGDLLVVNTSAAMAAAIDGTVERPGHQGSGEPVVVHVSTELPSSLWLVEVRTRIEGGSTVPDPSDRSGEVVRLRGGLDVTLVRRFDDSRRLWVASIEGLGGRRLPDHLAEHGRPIRYRYVERDWPLDSYRTVFGRRPGSAEMPSASRPFTTDLVTDLVSAGIAVAPLTLHTGVSSLESDEAPYPEWFDVPAATARLVNHTRRAGGRVVAVGTTVVRALESVVDDRGDVHPGHGWTDVVVTPDRGAVSVDGLLTGWHEPAASHLLMLEAIAAPGALELAYREAVAARYRWHEFGDVHLILR